MIYKEYQNKRLSALGLGAMRLPVIDGDDEMCIRDSTIPDPPVANTIEMPG